MLRHPDNIYRSCRIRRGDRSTFRFLCTGYPSFSGLSSVGICITRIFVVRSGFSQRRTCFFGYTSINISAKKDF
jgi:hypothetical protein